MALIGNSYRPWYVNDAGTAYKRDIIKRRVKDDSPLASSVLAPLLTGEAAGDFALAVLLATRNMIRTKDVYCCDARAKSKTGRPTEPMSADACQWSILGALDHVTYPTTLPEQKREIIGMIKRCLPRDVVAMPLFKWEEHRHTRHSNVIHLLNMAVAARKKELGYI